MTISSWVVKRIGSTNVIEVTSTLPVPVFHWYLDGIYQGATRVGRKSFPLYGGAQRVVEVLDRSPAALFDPYAEAPRGYPEFRRVWWRRSLDPNVREYEIRVDSATTPDNVVGIVPHDNRRWGYEWVTGKLADLGVFQVRVQAKSESGNVGAAVDAWDERIVRTPDAPWFDYTFDDASDRVTFVGPAP